MRLIILSNRLPFSIKRGSNGFEYKQSSGGLATGLICLKKTIDFLWIGNIGGIELTAEEKKTVEKDFWEKFKTVPVFISNELNDKAYNGFCNKILWPLFHSFSDDVDFNIQSWEAYKEYSQKFLEKLVEIVEDGDSIWVHDYHLTLLPKMIRDHIKKDIQIGYFLHTPFPSSEILNILPVRKEIVKGILGSNLIAFHSFDYLGHFINTCEKLIPTMKDFKGKIRSSEKIKYDLNLIDLGNHKAKMKAIPIGIDPSLFRDCLEKEETKNRKIQLREKFKGKTMILGVDRIDYIKGLPNRIKGFQRFLDKYPSLRDKVVFIQIGVPSRMDVHEYKSLVAVTNRMVGEINGNYGKADETFFYFLNQSIPFEELCALYSTSDICLISSVRDGMNLVALEYIACQDENNGILVLSEFAGALSTLPASLSINPWNIDQMADTIYQAINTSKEERKERHAINKRGVDTFTAARWAEDNVSYFIKKE